MAWFTSSEKPPNDDRSSSVTDQARASPDKLKQLDLEGQGHGVQSDSENGDVGRQIELEAENSIKYRTCSWQKVIATGWAIWMAQSVNLVLVYRLPPCSFLSISVWPSCRFRGHIPSWASFRV
jgi:hypothetical protein